MNIPSSSVAGAVPATGSPSVAEREVRITSLLIVAALLVGVVAQTWVPPGGVTLVAGAGLASRLVLALSFVVPGRLRETRIRTGLSNWRWTEVLDGIDAGARILASLDQEDLADGLAVQPEEAAETPP